MKIASFDKQQKLIVRKQWFEDALQNTCFLKFRKFHTCFPVSCEIFKYNFLYRTPPVAVSVDVFGW